MVKEHMISFAANQIWLIAADKTSQLAHLTSNVFCGVCMLSSHDGSLLHVLQPLAVLPGFTPPRQELHSTSNQGQLLQHYTKRFPVKSPYFVNKQPKTNNKQKYQQND